MRMTATAVSSTMPTAAPPITRSVVTPHSDVCNGPTQGAMT